MSDLVLDLTDILSADDKAKWVVNFWDNYKNQKIIKEQEQLELRNFLFATDTKTTSVNKSDWKNSTTIPKLTHIRDNLHSNYLASLFPNEKWLKWEAFDKNSADKAKAKAITAYMDNKAREGDFRTKMSDAVLDYIDWGNAFVMTGFKKKNHDYNGALLPVYNGPIAINIAPNNIVFNPTANSFEESWKVIRSLYTTGSLLQRAKDYPDEAYWEDVVRRRYEIQNKYGSLSKDDFEKTEAYQVDGFGSLYEYYRGDIIEVLEFYGSYYDGNEGILHQDQIITVVDRSTAVNTRPIPTYDGRAPIFHVSWRDRPENLYGMGPGS
jgi:hypothetical protein